MNFRTGLLESAATMLTRYSPLVQVSSLHAGAAVYWCLTLKKFLGKLSQKILMMIPRRLLIIIVMIMMKTDDLSLFPFRAGYAD